jgi:hypothetical protein
MTELVQLTLAGDVAEAEQVQGLLHAAGIGSSLEPAIEHDASVQDDPPLRVLVAETDVDAARDAIEALTEPDDPIEPSSPLDPESPPDA